MTIVFCTVVAEMNLGLRELQVGGSVAPRSQSEQHLQTRQGTVRRRQVKSISQSDKGIIR